MLRGIPQAIPCGRSEHIPMRIGQSPKVDGKGFENPLIVGAHVSPAAKLVPSRAFMDRRGRPLRGETWRDCIQKLGNQENIDGVTLREEIVAKTTKLALAGVPWAIQFLAEREDGRPAQAITINNNQQRNPMLDLSDEELADVIEVVRAKRRGEGRISP